MTRENAIKWLKTFRGRYGINELEDAVEIAIKALEQTDVLGTNVGELISRNAVLDLVANYDLSMGEVVRGIHDLPSFTPQPEKRTEKRTKTHACDCISRQAAEALFRNARKELMEQDRKKHIKDFNTRDLMLLNAEQLIHLLPSVTSGRSDNPERNHPESIKYCEECDHIEMCSWYPTDGCEWLKTDRYNAGYNAAKEEIALSGEYERAYQRGFEAGRKSEWTTVAESEDKLDGDPIDIDKAVEHYEGTLETLKGIDLEDKE